MDARSLFAKGLEHVKKMSAQIWNDYNLHDPGITTLELLCYALTDLSYRASLPVADILAAAPNGKPDPNSALFTARNILPNRPLTGLDYRKLLIDIPGIKNAWIQPTAQALYADKQLGKLSFTDTGAEHVVPIHLLGLYQVILEYENELPESELAELPGRVHRRLAENRNLCEDFLGSVVVEEQAFRVCGEIELSPNTDATRVNAELFFQINRYFSPPVQFYSLNEMLTREKSPGLRYTVADIFDGPLLQHGFIDDQELTASDLRSQIRLSDIINIAMDIDGVVAVRDLIIVAADSTSSKGTSKWVVPVEGGKKAVLDDFSKSRIRFTKRGFPIGIKSSDVKKKYNEWVVSEQAGDLVQLEEDLSIPAGKFQPLGDYESVQNHFPAAYGIGNDRLADPDPKRLALTYQLKGYLYFFDQMMANYFAQLEHVKELFSVDETLTQTYFYKTGELFRDFDKISAVPPDFFEPTGTHSVEPEKPIHTERRNRFLDHLISRFAEQFFDYAATIQSAFPEATMDGVVDKCRFIKDYPRASSERSLAYHYQAQAADLWGSDKNISGLERRIARLLGIRNLSRRNLGGLASGSDGEGMYVIENILLRPGSEGDPLMKICPDPNCGECADFDPYSYRLHVILPAENGRFANMNFRRFVEQTIREETPAHIFPKICWANDLDIVSLQSTYSDWLRIKAGLAPEHMVDSEPNQIWEELLNKLASIKNIYPKQKLHGCNNAPSDGQFVLGMSALGSQDNE
ncbi:MAG: diguanylate cyclase [Myxococcales bacterium]|nr:diguanylate cyclase [Myxococcales bacterium]